MHEEELDIVARVYELIVVCIYRAESIRIAEAAKITSQLIKKPEQQKYYWKHFRCLFITI